MLILEAIAARPSYGMELSRRIDEATEGDIRVIEGSLYPALHRLRKRGLVSSRWQFSATRRRARLYQITELGRKHLSIQTERWERFAAAVKAVVRASTWRG